MPPRFSSPSWSSEASLYKFGQAADLSHYEKAIEGICSKNAQHDHSQAGLCFHFTQERPARMHVPALFFRSLLPCHQAVPITKPMVLPRANLCTSTSG